MVHACDPDDIEGGPTGPVADLDGVVVLGSSLLQILLDQVDHLHALRPEDRIEVFDMAVGERWHQVLTLELWSSSVTKCWWKKGLDCLLCVRSLQQAGCHRRQSYANSVARL